MSSRGAPPPSGDRASVPTDSQPSSGRLPSDRAISPLDEIASRLPCGNPSERDSGLSMRVEKVSTGLLPMRML
jgi:hypothetical protein